MRSNPFASLSGGEHTARRKKRIPYSFPRFKVEIPKIEGRLDVDELLESVQTVERIFY